ncbi:MAG TPA: PQQ-binding-like beta-propeller repeat protein, partial [Pyrinomonadaceae bacterium]|nr:PQQ-binding-like beta-propeller repeat protein [Pyrinomonadaceae bacterium]
MKAIVKRVTVILVVLCAVVVVTAQDLQQQLSATPLKFGAFIARFDPGGTFTLKGQGWPAQHGNWKLTGSELELTTVGGPGGCDGVGKYRTSITGSTVTFELISDTCRLRTMILNGSIWVPEAQPRIVAAREIKREQRLKVSLQPLRSGKHSNWPSFRGNEASGVLDGQNLPDKWNAQSGENILWKTAIPGLAHSSPVVWGERIFVTTAVSSDPKATFRPGLYGDGDASKDRTPHSWLIYALDKHTGKIVWQRVAHQGEPIEKRHIKSTYANSTPATDGRIVVAWFGSQGVYAHDVKGRFLWKVDLGRVDLGAYDIPTYEWGPASSPIIWKDLVILQCDT